MLTVKIRKRDGLMVEKETITAGSVGFKVRVLFSSVWKDLTKWVSFRAGDVKMPVKITSTGPVAEVKVPWEVLVTAGLYLEMGIKGVSGDGELVIPTIYINLGRIQEGADTEGPEGEEPTPGQIEELWLALGEPDDLETEEKDTFVGAINEVLAKANAGGSGEGSAGADGVGIASITIEEV